MSVFAPIIQELERQGYTVVLTRAIAFRFAIWQTCFIFYQKVGIVWKTQGDEGLGHLLTRITFVAVCSSGQPALAVSHGSGRS
jgi:hypothetical protein